MKFNNISEQSTSQGARTIAVCAGIALIGSLAATAGPSDPGPMIEEEAAAEPATNWIELGIGGVVSSQDNDAAYQARHQNNGDVFGGIESFHFEQTTDNGNFLMEGRAMFGLDDYMLKLRYDRDDLGYIEAGYREFRTWFDGSGGYAGPGVAPPDDWVPLYDDELHLDRGEVWFEAGLRRPDIPQVTFRYSHIWRDGMKDSTIWGGAARGLVPSYYDIDETSDVFSLDLLHNIGNTALGAGLRYQSVDNEDTRNMRWDPGDADPDDDFSVGQTDGYDADLFSAHLFSETRFGDKLLLSFGYNFTTMDGDMSGDRPTMDRDGDLRTGSEHAYFALLGGSDTTVNTVSANLWWQPLENLVVVPSVRAEWWEQDTWATHIAGIRGNETVPGQLEGALAGIWPQLEDGIGPDAGLEEVLDMSDWEWEQYSEAIEFRYDGISNILAYAKAEFEQVNIDRSQSTTVDDHVDPIGIDSRIGTSDVDMQKYTLGANWYAAPGLSFAAQYYYKNYEQDFDNVLDGEDAQLKEHNYDTNDFNIRMTWRAAPCLTLVSRYDYQQTTIENRAYANDTGNFPPDGITPRIDSADIERNVFSQSATWTPAEWVYLQGSFHYIDSKTDTGTDAFTSGGESYIPDWEDEYWMVSLNAGFALDKRTDLQVGFFYYEADNFVNNSAISMPYGTDANEYAITARLNRRINRNMSWNAGYGYFYGTDDAYGGYNDYQAHVLSTGFRYSF